MKRETLKELYIIAVSNEASPEEFIKMIYDAKRSKQTRVEKKKNKNNIDYERLVCSEIGIPVKNLTERKRYRESHIYPRHICMYLRKKHTNESLENIGRRYGAGFDHATVLHANKNITNLIETDKKIKMIVDNIERKIAR